MGKLQKQMNSKKNNGITLIALVITIIVLLILAGVTIATLTGENGILTRASEASLETEIGEEEEAIRLAYSGVLADNNGTGVSAGELQDELRNNGYTNATVTDNGDGTYTVVFESGREYTINADGENTETGGTVVDGVTIPEGFYYVGGMKNTGLVVSDSVDDENKYKDQETVGTDLQGNQYVWIPVDGILGEDGTISDVTGNEKKILLGRYSFNSSGTLLNMTGTSYLEETQEEHAIRGYENTVANDIEGFIDSVRENGGYYIARYEACYGTDGKANSKVSTGYITENGVTPTQEGYLWNNIIQPDASTACQNLYEGVNSDLMNSYAWDTAILFIQKYSGDEDYSRQGRLQSTLANTGKATDGTNYDVRCNIYDMAGNCIEMTTETSTLDSTDNGTIRGGYYDSSNYYTSSRAICSADGCSAIGSFRPLLYL